MYYIPSYYCTGKRLVRLLKMVLSFLSPIKAKHNVLSSSAVYMYFVGAMSRIFRRALITAFLLLCVDCSPTLFLIMQSFSEAVDTDKYQ